MNKYVVYFSSKLVEIHKVLTKLIKMLRSEEMMISQGNSPQAVGEEILQSSKSEDNSFQMYNL